MSNPIASETAELKRCMVCGSDDKEKREIVEQRLSGDIAFHPCTALWHNRQPASDPSGKGARSGESWLAEVGFSDSRVHSSVEIAKLLEGYAASLRQQLSDTTAQREGFKAACDLKLDEIDKLRVELSAAQGKVSQLEAEHVAIAKALMVVFDGDCWEVGFENKDDGFPTLSAACKAIYEDSDAMQKRADKAESQVSVLTKERDELALDNAKLLASNKYCSETVIGDMLESAVGTMEANQRAESLESQLAAVSEVVRTILHEVEAIEYDGGHSGNADSHVVCQICICCTAIRTALTNYEKAQSKENL